VAKIFDGEEAEVPYFDLERVESHVVTSGFEKGGAVRVEHIRLQDK
jgi:hypothetical protein